MLGVERVAIAGWQWPGPNSFRKDAEQCAGLQTLAPAKPYWPLLDLHTAVQVNASLAQVIAGVLHPQQQVINTNDI